MQARNVTKDELESWLDQEHKYLIALKKEPEEDNWRFLYVEALQKLWVAE
jgi:hypothetical protein